MRLIVSPAAEADIAGAYTWYEDQRTGLGSEFVEEASSAIDAVHFEPLRFPAIHQSIRRALIHRFPYGLFFVPTTDTRAQIVVEAAVSGRCDAIPQRHFLR